MKMSKKQMRTYINLIIMVMNKVSPKRSNIILLLLLIFIYSCKDNSNLKIQDLKQDLEKQTILLSNGNCDSVLINVALMTNFSWDKLFIFKPYTSIETIDTTLTFKWNDAEESLISQEDDFNLLVFIRSGEVIYWDKIPRNLCDFIKLKKSGPFYYNNAIFIIKREYYDNESWNFVYYR